MMNFDRLYHREVPVTRAVWIAVCLSCLASTVCGQQRHWAYQPLDRPPVPPVQDGGWARQAIDCFTLHEMERRGLQPARQADPEVLIRRLSLDLTGLPPTWEQVTAFQDDLAPSAYERLVERLLSSPRFGERMAVPWLDLARYADTHGYHMDAHRDMWPWRDWVIQALNSNMPFDQFTVEQVGGDLLPAATLAQRIASGFNRNHMINFEDGSIPEEFRTEYVIDRVATTSTVWLGQTMACCRCHDHKYDPFTQLDFYRLFAFFNNVPENGIDGGQGNAAPVVDAPSTRQQQQRRQLEQRIAGCERALSQRRSNSQAAIAAWEPTVARKGGQTPLGEALCHLTFDGQTTEPPTPATTIVGNKFAVPGKFGQALLFDGQTHVVVSAGANLDFRDMFSIGIWVFPTTRDRMSVTAKLGPGQRGFELALDEGLAELRLSAGNAGNELRVRATTPVELRRWQHLLVAYDGSQRAAGVTLFIDGRALQTDVMNDRLRGSYHTDEPLRIGGYAQSPFRGMLDEVRIYARKVTEVEAGMLAGSHPLDDILTVPIGSRTEQQTARLGQYYLENFDESYRSLLGEQTAARRELHDLAARIPTVMVMQNGQPRETHVLDAGRYDRPGQAVSAGTPDALPAMAPDWPRNRLGLAYWLVHPSNPLTARVTVNRVWQLYFGTGLVATPDNFGTRGQPPSHPQLLDWLAVEFVESGWDVKHLHRLIVSSATYRQTSRHPVASAASEHANHWLAHGPGYRLSAEVIRDSLLHISGVLCEQLGGRSVFPYQPAGLWKSLSFDPDEYTAQVYRPGRGRDLYRRSLYTFWKRSVPPPPLEAFDAPSREVCTASRPRTNTPLQALVLMNEPTFVEAARVFAERILRDGGSTTAERIDFAVRLATARRPADEETHFLDELLKAQLVEYRRFPAAADDLLSVRESQADAALDMSELAAWTTVASVILSMDAVIRKY